MTLVTDGMTPWGRALERSSSGKKGCLVWGLLRVRWRGPGGRSMLRGSSGQCGMKSQSLYEPVQGERQWEKKGP